VIGGLARRAGALNAYESGGPGDILTLFGAYELQAPGAKPPGPPSLANALGRVYSRIDPDIMFMSPAEKRWLDFGADELPENTAVAGGKPVSRLFDTDGGKVGVVLFPMLPDHEAEPPPEVVRAVAEEARELRARAGLVIGMSPWGETGEARFLHSEGSVFHVLLGSGPGKGHLGRIECEQKTLWIRAFSRGIVLHVIDVLEWPENRRDWRWKFDENFRVGIQPLNDNWPLDMNVYRMLGEFPENPSSEQSQ
jgi:hypothetical protein